MAQVHLSGELKRLAGGAGVVDIQGGTVGAIIDELARLHPELGARLGEGLAVAVDGEVMPNPHYQAIETDTVIHFLPAIGGG